MNCPACNSANIQGRGKRHALYPLGIAAFVGLPFAMLHQAAAPHLYHCGDCSLDFTRRTSGARVAHVALITVIIAIAFAILASVGSAFLSSNR